jgi:hypothetical protein
MAGRSTGYAEHIRLELHQDVVGGGAAVGFQHRDVIAGVAFHRLQNVGDLEGDALQGGAGDMADLGIAAQADHHAAGVRVPVRRAQAGESGHEDRFPAPATEAATFATSGDFSKNCILSRSHCTTAPPMKTLPSSAYCSLRSALQAIVVISFSFESVNLSPMCLQQETAGAVGVLGIADADAELAEQRRLLIAGDARDLDVAEAESC